jgi:hypothetical protein
MKKAYYFIVALLIFKLCWSQQIVQVKYSKPFALIKFLETAKGGVSISKTFKHQIDTSYLSKDTAFLNILDRYTSLNLDYVYSKDQYPEKRKHINSTWDLLSIAAITANTNEEFFEKIIGLYPNSDYLKLKQAVTAVEPFYDAFIYSKKNKSVIKDKVRELQALSPKLNQLFDKFKIFYGSTWDKSIPFNLAIYPIEGNRGQTTATPHANSLEMGFLTKEDDNFELLSIGMHEMCHVLYDEQSLIKQQRIDSVFMDSTNTYYKMAYRYFDEALATALGNGYAYKYLSNELDSGEWYNDRYINLYAKALYPLIEQYLNQNRFIDKEFILKSIDLFKQTFPNAVYDIEPLLIKVDVYFDADTDQERQKISGILNNTFRIYSSNTSTPINDKISLNNIKQSQETQFIVIHKNQVKNMALLKPLFKTLATLPANKKNLLISFLDKNKRAVFIIQAENETKLKEAIFLLKKQKEIDPKKPWIEF